MIKILLAILFALPFMLEAQTWQDADMPFEREPGACYAKCLIQDTYEYEEIKIPTYTGGFPSIVELDTYEIWTEASTRWVKKQCGKCISEDPDDCLVWCIVEIPEEYEEIVIVKDTEDNPFFIWETITLKTLEKKGGYTEWRKVLCSKDVSQLVIKRLAKRLRELGYYSGDEIKDKKMPVELKSALVRCQKANSLPIGSLDFDTLGALEVVYTKDVFSVEYND